MDEQNITQSNEPVQSSKNILIIITFIIFITALVVGGGVYVWQRSVLKTTEQSLQEQINNLQKQIDESSQPNIGNEPNQQKPEGIVEGIDPKSLQEIQLEYLIGTSFSAVISKVLIYKSNEGYKMVIYPAKTSEPLEYPLENNVVESFTERLNYMLSKVKPVPSSVPVRSPNWEMKIGFTNSKKMTLMENGPLHIDGKIYEFEDNYDYNNRDPVLYITELADRALNEK